MHNIHNIFFFKMREEETIYIWYRKTCCTPVAWNSSSQNQSIAKGNWLAQTYNKLSRVFKWCFFLQIGLWMTIVYLVNDKIILFFIYTFSQVIVNFISVGKFKIVYFKSRLSPFNHSSFVSNNKKCVMNFPKTSTAFKFGKFYFVHLQGCSFECCNCKTL